MAFLRSIAGTVEEGAPEVMTTLVLPYRDDEYGVPVLQFSESDTDSESETTISKPKTNKTLPSIGPPQILQYKRDLNKPMDKQESADKPKGELGQDGGETDAELMNIDTVDEMITFTGNCEFCNNPIKPFPTLHQQQILSPQELYCCEEFANFVRLAILPPPPNSHLIDIKPHAHYGSKQARAAAREKAQARIREREVQRAQQSHHSAHTGSGTATASGAATGGGAGGPSTGGGGHHPSQGGVGTSGAQLGATGGAGGNMFALKVNSQPRLSVSTFDDTTESSEEPELSISSSLSKLLPPIARRKTSQKNNFLNPFNKTAHLKQSSSIGRKMSSTMNGESRLSLLSTRQTASSGSNLKSAYSSSMRFEDYMNARAMKTINFQLSSQRCIDEGYVIRPPSPLLDEEDVAHPFEVEPMEWFASEHHVDEDEIDFEDDEALVALRGRPPPRRKCVERYYPNEEKFLTMFPDGTGNVFYPNGQLAISVSSVEPGQFTYVVYDTQTSEGTEQQLLAEFEPDAVATCYHRSTGNIRLYLDQLGGFEAHPDGSRKRKWSWLDQTTHQHAPPVQPLCFALNKYIGVRVLNQDNVSMTFLCSQRSCRFNVGVKLKLVHPENLPPAVVYDDDQIFMNEKTNRVSGLLDKIENLLKYPHSTRADKIRQPKRVTIKAERIEKQKKQAYIARENERLKKSKKYTRPLPPIDQSDADNVLITEPGELSAPHTQRGGRSKHPVVVVN